MYYNLDMRRSKNEFAIHAPAGVPVDSSRKFLSKSSVRLCQAMSIDLEITCHSDFALLL